MNNHIIKKITFNKSYWFEHNGNNPNAIAKIEKLKKEQFFWSFDSSGKIVKEKGDIRKWKKLTIFKKNESIVFQPGLNIIVGENGSGKSTLLKCIIDAAFGKLQSDKLVVDAEGDIRALDFETGNPRYSICPHPDDKSFLKDSIGLMFVNQESHGETLTKVFSEIINCNETCIILDEPETALSLKNQYKYLNMLKEKSKTNQIIAVTHCKTFIENSEKVFDMNKRRWMTGEEYIKNIEKIFENL